MIKTFISHTSSDHYFINWLKTKLEREKLGLDIFIDDGSVFVGDDPQKMIDQVKKSIVFISVLSNVSVKKEFVLNELKTALDCQITNVFPIKYKCDKFNIPKDIKIKFSCFDKVEGKIYEDFSNEEEWEIHYENLRRAIFNKIVELGLLTEKDTEFYKDCEHLDLILKRDEPTTLERKIVIDVYLKKEEYQRYFFSKLVSVTWLKFLIIYGFFKSPPEPIELIDSPGNFQIPHWYVLDYLERISVGLEDDSEDIIEQVLNIMCVVTNFKDEHGKHLDNYRIWWYFVKILLNIPNDKIADDVINLIPIWLGVKIENREVSQYSKFDTSLPGSEIATKLLPKFLDSDNPEDWKKAERIIEIITTIKWKPAYSAEYKKQIEEKYKSILDKPEKKRTEEEKLKISFLDLDKEEPQTVLDTYWLLESLKKNADKIAEKCSGKVIFDLADKMKQIFNKEYSPAHPTIEFRGTTYRMTIEQSGDFDYSIWINLEEEILERKVSLEEKPHIELKGCRDKKTFIERVKLGLLKRPKFKGLKDELDGELKTIYELLPQDFSFMWFRNLFSDPELRIYGTEETLTAILRDVTLAEARRNKEVTLKGIFSKFFGSEYRYPIFRRIVLFVIGEEWNTYKEYFWQLGDEQIENLFTYAVFEPELYTLLEMNINKFSEKEKVKINSIIKKGSKKEQYTEKQINYWKQKWYSAVKADPYFAHQYEDQKKVTQIDEEIIFKEPEIKWGPDPSPLTKKEIISMSNEELAKYLNEFRTKDRWRGPTVSGLSEVLKSAVQESPEKFIENLNPFLDVGYLHIYAILWGIRDAWTNKKLIDWRKLFKFIKQYIGLNDFWQDKFKVAGDDWNVKHLWVTGMIGELIQEGTKDDAWAFSEENFKRAEEIVFLILEKQKVREEKEMRNAVIHALNSTHGKMITALIYLALRIARVEAKKGIKKEIKWSNDIREKYEKVLKDEIIEAYTLLGQYMGNLLYVDKKWVKEKIQSISPSEIDLWEAFMEGYLWASKVHEYELMRDHFFEAIEHEFKEKRIEERLIQYICLGYLGDKENFNEDSLFGRLLKKWKESQVEVIIKFFWAHHQRLVMEKDEKKSENNVIPEKDKIIKKIIDFWQWVYDTHYKTKGSDEINEEDKVILSNLSLLTVFLPQIDLENFEWLKLSARYVETRFNSNFFIEYLDRLKDEKCYVGEIFLEMLNNFVPYPHPESHIKSIVEYLYEIGRKANKEKCKESANKICNSFGENEFDFLRALYERYNPSV